MGRTLFRHPFDCRRRLRGSSYVSRTPKLQRHATEVVRSAWSPRVESVTARFEFSVVEPASLEENRASTLLSFIGGARAHTLRTSIVV
jgi:hypothetical protein